MSSNKELHKNIKYIRQSFEINSLTKQAILKKTYSKFMQRVKKKWQKVLPVLDWRALPHSRVIK